MGRLDPLTQQGVMEAYDRVMSLKGSKSKE